jgi:hypothetical protein
MSLSPPSERGSALIGVLLLLMMMSALTAAFAVSGHTETLVVRNHQTAAQARAAAEAGLNYAAQQTIEWLALWPNTYADADQAVDALLANPDLVGFDFADAVNDYTPFEVSATGVDYKVELMDEDDPDRGSGYTTLVGSVDANEDEAGDNPLDDENRNLVIRAIGRGQSNASVTLEAIITPLKLPAIITHGDLTVSGSVDIIAGANGGIHSNGNLSMSGTSVVTGINPDDPLDLVGGLANGTARSSGTYTSGIGTVTTGDAGGGEAVKPLPNVRASFYRSWADYILESTGQLTCANTAGCSVTTYTGLTPTTTAYANGAIICDASTNPHNQCRDWSGWIFDDDGDGSWTMNLNDPDDPDGTYYIEGPAQISGSPGNAIDPVNLTLFAEGSIDISGAPNLTPDSTELLFVTDGDLQITGNFNMPLSEGQILIHEQVRINSSACVILGQIVVEDAEDDDGLVTANSIQGLVLSYTGDVGNTIFSVSGWREVR